MIRHFRPEYYGIRFTAAAHAQIVADLLPLIRAALKDAQSIAAWEKGEVIAAF
jgi:hypothetical protein